MFTLLMSLLAIQRILELAICRRNRKRLYARGAIEYGKGHYPLMVALHVSFYVSLVLEYAFVSAGWDRRWPIWLALLLAAEVGRVWVMSSLGPYWNTRIVLVPGAEMVRKGPYRFIRHPNYVVIVVELLSVSMLCGAYMTAAVFTVLNLLMLRVRIREEERALAEFLPQYKSSRLPRFLPRLPGS
jgi:methyltransferase